MATASKMNIIAGEPVPPGFEDEVNRVPEIQQAIDQYQGNALLGLEYTLELHEDDRHEPSYYCVLCDKRGDPRTIMQHWTSFNHRLKYLEKHYPSAAREFNPVKYTPNSHSILIGIVQSLAEAIEDHYGRLTLAVCNGDEFRRLKSKIINEVNAKYHYDERSGPNFLHVIDRTLWENKTPSSKMEQTLQITIKAPKRINEELGAQSSRDGLDEISSDSDGQGTSKKVKKKREQSPAFRILPRVRRSPPFEEERGSKENEKNEKKLPTPKELSLQASHIAQEKYKWEKYRCMLEIQLKQMGKIQQDYEKNPEKHPLYPEEWKKFWNRRYKELQAEKKTDPNKYDYKPEWIVFWTKRMKDLYNVEMDKKKKELKLKLGLPQDAEEKIEQLKEKYKVQVSRSATGLGGNTAANVRAKAPPSKVNSGREREKNTTDVIDISDDESPARRRSRSQSRSHSHSHSRSRRSQSATRNAKRSRGRSESLSDSPLSDEYEPRPIHHQHHSHHHHRLHAAPPVRGYPPIESDYYAALAYSRTRYSGAPSGHYGAPAPHYRVLEPHQYPKYERSPSPNSRSTSVKEDPEPENDGPLTVVAVLRLLTALEEHLGSLGPKVVDLLGKALALEKVKAYSADDLLLNDDHCVFFETIKEKLKGLLIADVLDDQQKVRAVKRAIKNIAAVVHQVTTKGSKADTKGEEAAGSKDEKPVKKAGTVACVKDLPFDRQVVATKLAAALVMQGREDVSTEDMDKLIFMFILMVKLSKAKSEIDGKPVLTKNILPELGIPVPKSTMAALAALPALVDELFENDVSPMVHEAVEEVSNSNDTAERDSKNDPNSSMLESLTDSDLQTLLQNFKHLSTEEQHHLIAHLKKLETADPSRVEKLRKFVNIGDLAEVASTSASASAANSNRKEAQRSNKYDDLPSPGTNKERSKYSEDEGNDRRRGVNVTNPNKFSLDDEDEDEDDDYNVEDVFKAAINNVGDSARQSKSESTKSTDTRGKSSQKANNIEPIVPVLSSPNALTFNPAGLNISLSDTQTLIANLMGSLQQSNANQKASGSKAAQSNAPQSASAVQTISTTTQQRQQQQQQQQQMQHQSALQSSAPYYQQGQHQGYGNGYNQMAGVGDQTQAYYNTMGGYNNGAAGYPGYQQWGGSSAQNMQQYGMQNFMTPQQQQQQQQPSYNMYGHGPN